MIKKESRFQWSYSGEKNYRISECSYIMNPPKYIPLEIVCFEGDFDTSYCFQIGSWKRDNHGYEFHSCCSRLFNCISKKDLKEVWKGLKKADKFLNARWQKEEEDNEDNLKE